MVSIVLGRFRNRMIPALEPIFPGVNSKEGGMYSVWYAILYAGGAVVYVLIALVHDCNIARYPE